MRAPTPTSHWFSLQRVNRWFLLPLGPAIAGGVWLGLVGLWSVVAAGSAHGLSLCHFRALTGQPCLTCRGTHAALAAAHGHLVEAFMLNPLVMLCLLAVSVWLVLRIGFRRSVRLNLASRWRKIVMSLAVVAALANWIYIIADEGSNRETFGAGPTRNQTTLW